MSGTQRASVSGGIVVGANAGSARGGATGLTEAGKPLKVQGMTATRPGLGVSGSAVKMKVKLVK